MSNTLIIIWLILLTGWVGYQQLGIQADIETSNNNREVRQERYENTNERLKNIESYLNEDLNKRFKDHTDFISKKVVPYLHSHD